MFLPANITLQFGDSGDFVAELQRRLAAVKAHGDDAINGFYDGVTVNSVSAFQSRSGLRADGIAGPETLRKLNGVISGDTSATDNKNEEEEKEKQRVEALRLQQLQALEQQQAMSQTPISVDEAVLGTVAVGGLAAAVMANEIAPQAMAHAAPISLAPDAQHIQQQLQHEAQLHQMHQPQQAHQPHPPHQNSGDLLAQMLLQQTAGLQPSAPAVTPELSPRAQAAAQSTHAAAPAAHVSPTAPMPPQQAASVPVAETQAVAPQEQPRGLVGRAIQKVDALVQRLSEYFEAKLPPDVLHEVKQAGQTMLQSGVREVAIPAGPEQTRAPAAPARGPEQQQIPQRG